MLAPTRFLAVTCLLGLSQVALAADPLHTRIDRHITKGFAERARLVSPQAGDEEFLRRVYLDLVGTIPPVAEVNAFLADSSADKRVRLIDHLLASPGYARRMAWHFDVMLMERGKDVKVPRQEWESYLLAAFTANTPYDALVRDLLSNDGVDSKTRPAAKFLLERDMELQVVTRDISRVFLGRDIQCAQCHDHPAIDDYKQADYYGIQAFLNRSFLFPNTKAATAVIAEKADGDVSFTSVFDKAKKLSGTPPHMPGSQPIADPQLAKGKQYQVAPAKDVKPIPTYSRRALLAGELTRPANTAFARNAVNRIWAMMMGRGIVHPLDMDHAGNPPSHPELLDDLTADFVAHKYDIKWLVREIALSDAYQRSSELAPGANPQLLGDRYLAAVMKPLTAEQFAYAAMQAVGHTDAERTALGAKATAQQLDARLAGLVPAFRATFGRGADATADNFISTLDQTLFLKYGATVRKLIPSRTGNLAFRLGKLTNPDAFAEELFVAVLTRRPTADERADVAATLRTPTDRPQAINEIIWAMLTSAEFRFNH